MAFTELLEQAGGVGLFQALQALTLLLLSVWVPFQFLVENFSAAVPGHRCWAHVLDNGSEAPANLTPEALLAVSIPLGPNREPHQCLRFRQPQWQLLDPNATATNWSEAATEPCVDGWVYNRSTFTSTIVTEWDLVCDHQSLKPLGQSIYMAGTMLGSIAWGLLSHRLGRKPILSWCCLQVAVANISTIAAPSFLVYCGLRFLNALGLAGIILTSMTLMVEWTTTCKRAITMTMLGCSYSIGQTALGGMAFALRDWRALQLAVSVPFFVIFLMSWWLPESARWLIIMGKPDQALQELKKVARINGHKEAQKTLTIEVLMSRMEEELASTKARQSVLDLFRVPALRWRSCSLLVVKFADPACGLRCAGKRMFWHKLNLPHGLQAGTLPNFTADDSRRLPAFSNLAGVCDGPPDQDDPPGPAPAARDFLRCPPHCFQPHCPLPPGDPGTSTPGHHPGPGETGEILLFSHTFLERIRMKEHSSAFLYSQNCLYISTSSLEIGGSPGQPARGSRCRKHQVLEILPAGVLLANWCLL
uniref:Solute carrier family 22 member 11 isoform X2 n=1 Tax=Camelus bactrianus TaxID=9837 RepID=A0A9W3HJI4_CAMBA|nr:solute carrier family 22 member 11 isoform X2 [Camelus bactrianus]